MAKVACQIATKTRTRSRIRIIFSKSNRLTGLFVVWLANYSKTHTHTLSKCAATAAVVGWPPLNPFRRPASTSGKKPNSPKGERKSFPRETWGPPLLCLAPYYYLLGTLASYSTLASACLSSFASFASSSSSFALGWPSSVPRGWRTGQAFCSRQHEAVWRYYISHWDVGRICVRRSA